MKTQAAERETRDGGQALKFFIGVPMVDAFASATCREEGPAVNLRARAWRQSHRNRCKQTVAPMKPLKDRRSLDGPGNRRPQKTDTKSDKEETSARPICGFSCFPGSDCAEFAAIILSARNQNDDRVGSTNVMACPLMSKKSMIGPHECWIRGIEYNRAVGNHRFVASSPSRRSFEPHWRGGGTRGPAAYLRTATEARSCRRS